MDAYELQLPATPVCLQSSRGGLSQNALLLLRMLQSRQLVSLFMFALLFDVVVSAFSSEGESFSCVPFRSAPTSA